MGLAILSNVTSMGLPGVFKLWCRAPAMWNIGEKIASQEVMIFPLFVCYSLSMKNKTSREKLLFNVKRDKDMKKILKGNQCLRAHGNGLLVGKHRDDRSSNGRCNSCGALQKINNLK